MSDQAGSLSIQAERVSTNQGSSAASPRDSSVGRVVPELLDERPVADRQTERSVRCEEKITQALGQEAARAKESESGHRP
jgi:hypothetical protein